MIVTTAAYKTAINADERYIVPRVDVYFDGDTSDPTTFNEASITSIKFLEEAKADSDNPLGAVSANEITIGFDNSNRDFTPTNLVGAYYGKLRPNILVKEYIGVEVDSWSYVSPGFVVGRYFWIPLGVFRTGDWESPSSSVEATVTCYDNLYAIGNKTVPMLPVKSNTTIYAMFESLFLALGLTTAQYNIDTSLNQSITIGWLPDGKVRAALQALAIAGNCNVTADRYGVIQVKNNFQAGSSVATWTDTDQIVTAENPQKYLDCYNSIKVNYKLPYVKAEASLLKVENLTVPQGGLTLEEIDFTSKPVAVVSQVKLSGAIHAAVASVQYGANTITVVITNTGVNETVTLEVTGQAVGLINSVLTKEDANLVTTWGRRQLVIDNDLIQSADTALSYAVPLLQYLKDPSVNFSLSIRGDPAIEINDIIEIQDPTDKIGTVDIVPIRINIDYDGALSATVEARKPIVPYDWVFVSPGMVVYAPRSIA